MDISWCDKELILEGPKMDISKLNPIVQEDIVQNVPLMPMKMEIMSIEDFKLHEESQVESQGDTEQVEDYYDASYGFFSKEEIKTLKAKVTKWEQRRMKWLQQAMLKLRDGCQVQATLSVNPYRSNAKVSTYSTLETKENEAVEEDQS